MVLILTVTGESLQFCPPHGPLYTSGHIVCNENKGLYTVTV